MGRRVPVVGFAATAALVILTACKAQSLPTTSPIRDKADLVRALQTAGAQLEEAQLEPLVPSVPGESWRVDGEIVQLGDLRQGSGAIQRKDLEAWAGSEGRGRAMVWIGPGWYAAYAGRDGGLILLLSGLLGDPLRPTAVEPGEPFPPALPMAMRTFSRAHEREPQEVTVLDYQAVNWPDACLGIDRAGAACVRVETPGWLIQVSLDGEVYDLHSDETGESVVWDEPRSP